VEGKTDLKVGHYKSKKNRRGDLRGELRERHASLGRSPHVTASFA
jgi:hypothetical protein